MQRETQPKDSAIDTRNERARKLSFATSAMNATARKSLEGYSDPVHSEEYLLDQLATDRARLLDALAWLEESLQSRIAARTAQATPPTHEDNSSVPEPDQADTAEPSPDRMSA